MQARLTPEKWVLFYIRIKISNLELVECFLTKLDRWVGILDLTGDNQCIFNKKPAFEERFT
jgi:hypothetical protein